jgi:hypothetical protein
MSPLRGSVYHENLFFYKHVAATRLFIVSLLLSASKMPLLLGFLLFSSSCFLQTFTATQLEITDSEF